MITKQNTFNLDDFVPYKLSIASQSVSRLIAQDYEHKFGLSMTQWRVLVIICNSAPLTANDICEKSLFEKMTISRAVKSLYSRKMIDVFPAKDDRRKRMLSATSLGKKIYEEVLPIAQAHEANLLSCLTDSEKLLLNSILDKISLKTIAE